MSILSHFIFRRDSTFMVTVPQLQASASLENPPSFHNPYEEETADLYRSRRTTTLGNMFGCQED